MKNKILKPLTVVIFLSLVTGFVAYQSGKITNPLSTSPNRGNIPLAKESPKDTPVNKDSVMVPTPKRHVVADYEFDSTKHYTKEDSERINHIRIMSSSKSMILTEPKFTFDSTKIRQLRQK
jgi:hypothetical protein